MTAGLFVEKAPFAWAFAGSSCAKVSASNDGVVEDWCFFKTVSSCTEAFPMSPLLVFI